MSYSDPGAAYGPPPPPARARSPWMFVGIGCGALLLLVVVAIAVFIGNLSKTMQAEMQKPYDRAAVMKSLRDTPVYPNALFHEESSKAMRAALSSFKWAMPADEIVAIAYYTNDTPEKVMTWYDEVMPKKGYEPRTSGGMPTRQDVIQNQYQKGNDRVMIQVQNAPGNNPQGQTQGRTMIAVFRFNGFKGKD